MAGDEWPRRANFNQRRIWYENGGTNVIRIAKRIPRTHATVKAIGVFVLCWVARIGVGVVEDRGGMKIGTRTYYLTTTSAVYRHNDRSVIDVRCDCGVEKTVQLSNLRNGTKSCGCFKQRKMRNEKTTHKQTGTPLYNVWASMVRRCTDPNCEAYPVYSKLGVCDEWRKFEIFWGWAKTGYRPGLTLDRRYNSRGYSPDNCRWVDRSVQAQNRGKRRGCTSSKYIGVSQCRGGWQARVTTNGKAQNVGTFKKELDAAKARDRFIIDSGTQHQLNFPEII